jgi:hypothetical protein
LFVHARRNLLEMRGKKIVAQRTRSDAHCRK